MISFDLILISIDFLRFPINSILLLGPSTPNPPWKPDASALIMVASKLAFCAKIIPARHPNKEGFLCNVGSQQAGFLHNDYPSKAP